MNTGTGAGIQQARLRRKERIVEVDGRLGGRRRRGRCVVVVTDKNDERVHFFRWLERRRRDLGFTFPALTTRRRPKGRDTLFPASSLLPIAYRTEPSVENAADVSVYV